MRGNERASDQSLRRVVTPLAVILGVVVAAYTLISGASLPLGITVAGALWLYVLHGWLRGRGWSARRTENVLFPGIGALAVLFALIAPTNLVVAVWTPVLLWIGVNVARIKRRLGADDAEP